jgi:hypothetical protein
MLEDVDKRAFSRFGRAIAFATAFSIGFAVQATPAFADRLADLRTLGSRAEGSPGESAAFDYIERALRGMGLIPTSSGFSDIGSEAYSRSKILEAELRGARADELAIVVPIGSWADSPDPTEGAYGIALALDEAERLSAAVRSGSSLPVSLRFVFLGAEKRGSYAEGDVAGLGTKSWIRRQEGRAALAVIYLNMPEYSSRVEMRSAARGLLAPYWYYEASRISLDGAGVDSSVAINRLQAYRLSLASDYGPSAPYLEAGIPAIELRGESGAADGSARAYASSSGSWLGSFVDRLGRELSSGFPDIWDRHYFIFQIGRTVAVLREKLYVAFLVCVVAIALASFLVATVARRQVMKRLMKRAPGLAAGVFSLFGALVLVFVAGKGIILLESAILGSPTAWTLSPKIFAIARVASSLFLFLSLLSLLIERNILTPNPYFYELAALLCLAVDVLVFSAADLSASFYFMWALILVELSLALRKRWATIVAYLLMYAPLLFVAEELVIRPDLGAYAKLISPDIWGLLGLSALSFPFFVFTASPLLFFSRRGKAARRRASLVLFLAALVVEAIALGTSLAIAPFSGPGRKDISLSERIDQDSGRFEVELSGQRRLGSGILERDGDRLDYRSLSDHAILSGIEGRKLIMIGSNPRPFLDRADENVSILFARAPYSVDISLVSGSEILLYDCSLPYKVAVDGKSVTIFSVINPGAKLDFTLTVPSSFRSKLVVKARYLALNASYAQSSGSHLRDAGSIVQASFALDGPRPSQ